MPNDEKTPTRRTYTVLELDGEDRWSVLAQVQATTQKTAVEAALKSHEREDGGTFVALARFEPVTVKPETKTRLVWS